MKTFRIILELIAVWIITILVFSAYVAFSPSYRAINEGVLMFVFGWGFTTLIFAFFAFIFSLPSFLVFFTAGMIILHMPINPWIKKSILAAINLTGIFIAFFIIYYGLAHYNKDDFSLAATLKNNRIEGPLVSLSISSLLSIFLMPFPDTRKPKPTFNPKSFNRY